jgi:hypothetical protein
MNRVLEQDQEPAVRRTGAAVALPGAATAEAAAKKPLLVAPLLNAEVDGDLGEWEHVEPVSLPAQHQRAEAYPAWKGPHDLSARCWGSCSWSRARDGTGLRKSAEPGRNRAARRRIRGWISPVRRLPTWKGDGIMGKNAARIAPLLMAAAAVSLQCTQPGGSQDQERQARGAKAAAGSG